MMTFKLALPLWICWGPMSSLGFGLLTPSNDIHRSRPLASSFGIVHPQRLVDTKDWKKSNPQETKDKTASSNLDQPLQRFERTATAAAALDRPCILELDGKRYNLTAWAKSHPGGAKVLQKFHGRDASEAFATAHHSSAAYAMLKDFQVDVESVGVAAKESSRVRGTPRWRAKLFTKEDPIGVHKYLGLFCLSHFVFRFFQMYWTDPSAGLGTRLGKGPSWIAFACIFPHALLSLSSLIFDTVPRDRVVGRPMIWQEYRVHNIVFGIRSVVTTGLCSLSVRFPGMHRTAVWLSCLCLLASNLGADAATACLRSVETESTTATMPYWEGCSLSTQKRFKTFYAYSQFLATLATIAVYNPAWPLSVLLAIQCASLFMTLVRKGLLSAKGYHALYSITLAMPYFVGFRSMAYCKSPFFLGFMALGLLLYEARRRGVSKYILWTAVIAGRVTVGDQILGQVLDYSVI